MAVFLEVIDAAGNVTRLPVAEGRIDVAAQPGTIYRVVDADGAAIGSGPRVIRIDDDLVITDLPGGEVVGITEFFSACTPSNPCTLSLAELGGVAEETITPASEPVAALQEGGFLMNRSASVDQTPVAPEAEGDFNWKPIAAAGGGLLVLGAIAGGGGGGGGDDSPPPAPTLTTTSVNTAKPVLEGQAEANSRVTVTIDVGGSGQIVRYATTADANGNWSVDLATDSPILGILPDEGLPANESSPISLVATDSAGNASDGASTAVVIDTTPPVAVATLDSVTDDVAPISGAISLNGVTNDATPTLTGTLSAALDQGDVVVVLRDGQVVGQASVSGTDFVFTDGPLADSNGQTQVVYTVQVQDAAGNATTATVPFSFAVDRTGPAAPTITDPVPGSTITAAQSQSGLTVSGTVAASSDATSVAVTIGGVTQQANVDQNNTWSTVIAPGQLPPDGNVSILARAIDAAGNTGADAATTAITLDRTPPTVSITSDSAGSATNSPFTVTFVFSEPVTGFTAADVQVSGGTTGSLSGSGTTYTMVVSPAAGLTGNAVVTVPANTVIDSSGNPNTAGSFSQPIDTLGPSLTITDNVSGTATGPVTFTFTFSESVNGFTAGDINVNGGTPGAFTQVNGSTYTLVVTPGGGASGTITVNVGNNAVTDGLGNPNTSANASQPYVNDVTPPTLNITDNVAGANATGPVTFTFQFSEPVTGFSAGDITVTGGTAGTFNAASSTIYTLVVQPGTAASGTINVSVPAGAAQDAAGNQSEAASASQDFVNDVIDPVLTITDNVPSGNATGPVVFTFTFDEPVSGFNASDIVVTGGSPGSLVTVSASEYQMTVVPGTAPTGTINVSVAAGAAQDASGNPSEAASATQPFINDNTDPVLTITDNEAAANATGPVTFTFQFDEPVTGFIAGDIVVTGGTAGAFTAVNTTQYTLVVTPDPTPTGTINISVPAGAAEDASGNPSEAATASQDFVNDNTDPVLTITDNVPSIDATGPVTFTFTFDEPVTGFTAADVTVTGGTAGSLVAVSTSEYEMVVTPASNDVGTIEVTVAAGAAQDASGNPSEGDSRTQDYDTTGANDNILAVSAADVLESGATLFAFSDAGAGQGATQQAGPSAGSTSGGFETSPLDYQRVDPII